MTIHSPHPVQRGLIQVRWLLIGLQVLVALGFLAVDDPEHRPLGLLAVVGLLGLVDLARARGLAPGVLGHVGIDLAALAALATLWGPHHPLQALALVEMTLVATVLPARQAWTVTALAVGLTGLDAALQAGIGEDALHLVSHVGITAVAAISLTWFSLALGGALVEQNAAREAAEADREQAARLAVVGTLAAGVAHELATPLGSIALLADEAEAEDAPDARRQTLDVLRAQVRRCRAILDRLLQRGDAALRESPAIGSHLGDWVRDWSAANPGVDVRIDVPDDVRSARVRGDADAWRGSVWTLLDNARRAGGPIEVAAARTDGSVEVCVADRGPGLSPEAERRAGEPFWSAWPDGGTGLGLYALRSLVDAVGGRFRLEPRPDGGALARLTLPEVP